MSRFRALVLMPRATSRPPPASSGRGHSGGLLRRSATRRTSRSLEPVTTTARSPSRAAASSSRSMIRKPAAGGEGAATTGRSRVSHRPRPRPPSNPTRALHRRRHRRPGYQDQALGKQPGWGQPVLRTARSGTNRAIAAGGISPRAVRRGGPRRPRAGGADRAVTARRSRPPRSVAGRQLGGVPVGPTVPGGSSPPARAASGRWPHHTRSSSMTSAGQASAIGLQGQVPSKAWWIVGDRPRALRRARRRPRPMIGARCSMARTPAATPRQLTNAAGLLRKP